MHQSDRDADATGDGSIPTWSSHHCPTGTPVRTVLCRDDEQAPIRLVLGSTDQVQLDLSLAVAGAVITNLARAADEITEHPAGDDAGPGSDPSGMTRPATARFRTPPPSEGDAGTGGRLPDGDGPASLDGRG